MMMIISNGGIEMMMMISDRGIEKLCHGGTKKNKEAFAIQNQPPLNLGKEKN